MGAIRRNIIPLAEGESGVRTSENRKDRFTIDNVTNSMGIALLHSRKREGNKSPLTNFPYRGLIHLPYYGIEQADYGPYLDKVGEFVAELGCPDPGKLTAVMCYIPQFDRPEVKDGSELFNVVHDLLKSTGIVEIIAQNNWQMDGTLIDNFLMTLHPDKLNIAYYGGKGKILNPGTYEVSLHV